jgi:hypothetical protein
VVLSLKTSQTLDDAPVGLVGFDESPPPQPDTVPTISSTATTQTAHLRVFSVIGFFR